MFIYVLEYRKRRQSSNNLKFYGMDKFISFKTDISFRKSQGNQES